MVSTIEKNLRRHLADGRTLKEVAHREFIRAMRTGRMTAFVGSYATVNLGYPNWEGLLQGTLPVDQQWKEKYLAANTERAVVRMRQSFFKNASMQARLLSTGWNNFSKSVDSKLIDYELLSHLLTNRPDPDGLGLNKCKTPAEYRKWQKEIVEELFGLGAAKKAQIPPAENTVWQVCRNLGVRRIITLNYDMEFEYELMIDEADRYRETGPSAWLNARKSVFKRCQDQGIARRERAMREEGMQSRFDYAIDHTLPNSLRVVSDCFQRERSDKLFEFAIHSPDYAWHIMHLHGRISNPETLIISYDDYENQYRRDDVTKGPFEHALKLLFAGNPILFVGTGMSEEEVLGTLRQFVSDGRPSHIAQHFVVWSLVDGELTPEKELFRLRLYRQFGVYMLFDSEIEGFYTAGEFATALPRSIDSLARFAEKQVTPFDWRDQDDKPYARDVSLRDAGLTGGGDFRDLQGYLPAPRPKDDWSPLIPTEADKLSSGAAIWATKRPGAAICSRTARRKFSEIEIDWEPIAHSTSASPVNGGIGYGEKIGSIYTDEQYISHVVTGGSPIKAFIDPPGSGHGSMAAAIADFILDKVVKGPSVLNPFAPKGEIAYFQLNSSFSWELDSAFSLVSGLYDDRTAYRSRMSRDAGARDYFERIARLIEDKQPIPRALFIAINGADRFFDPSGFPLSNELDLLIRRLPDLRRNLIRHHTEQWRARGGVSANLAREAIKDGESDLHDYIHDINGGLHPVTLLLFGSSRIGRYLTSLDLKRGDLSRNLIRDFDIISGKSEPFESSEPEVGLFRRALSEIYSAQTSVRPTEVNPFEEANVRRDADLFRSVYFSSIKQAFLSELVSGSGPKIEKKRRERLAELVPVASRTDLHRTRDHADDQRKVFFDTFLDSRLLAQVLPFKGRQTQSDNRALRVALALEIIRVLAFLGMPVSPDTLICAIRGVNHAPGREPPLFLDGDYLEQQVPGLLEHLVRLKLVLGVEQYPEVDPSFLRYGLHRALLHEIRDRNSVPFSDARNYTSFNIPLMAAQPIDDHEPKELVQLALERMVDELLDPKSQHLDSLEYGLRLRAACASMRSYYTTSTLLMHDPTNYKPELIEHADRLGELIHYAEMSAKRRRDSQPNGQFQPPNFFADDLVWLHAQRGVALQAAGDLYGARDSLRKARRINAEFVEFGEHGQNWRRIQLNSIQIDIERAKIGSAEAKLRDLRQSICSAVSREQWEASWYVRTGEKKPRDAFEAIMQAYGSEQRLRVRDVDPHFAADLILATGLACGFSGWCEYLRGRLRTAEHYMKHCIQILRNVGEQRAYAYFCRHYASLLYALGDVPRGYEVLNLCQAAADSARQMDISHLASLSAAEHRLAERHDHDRPAILRSVMDSLHYATRTDMYRVRMESRRVLALMRFEDGDFDGALEQASEALAVAVRFGFTLRKISLRILIGQILVKRGDPISGNAMLEQALRIADRLGYQRAVEEVHRVRVIAGGEPIA